MKMSTVSLKRVEDAMNDIASRKGGDFAQAVSYLVGSFEVVSALRHLDLPDEVTTLVEDTYLHMLAHICELSGADHTTVAMEADIVMNLLNIERQRLSDLLGAKPMGNA